MGEATGRQREPHARLPQGHHLSEATVRENAPELVDYLHRAIEEGPRSPSVYASDDSLENLHEWGAARVAVTNAWDERRSLLKDARLYVGNLQYDVTQDDVIEAFALHGFSLKDVFLSRGFAFVSLASAEDAERALERMQRARVKGRPVRIGPAEKRQPKPG